MSYVNSRYTLSSYSYCNDCAGRFFLPSKYPSHKDCLNKHLNGTIPNKCQNVHKDCKNRKTSNEYGLCPECYELVNRVNKSILIRCIDYEALARLIKND